MLVELPCYVCRYCSQRKQASQGATLFARPSGPSNPLVLASLTATWARSFCLTCYFPISSGLGHTATRNASRSYIFSNLGDIPFASFRVTDPVRRTNPRSVLPGSHIDCSGNMFPSFPLSSLRLLPFFATFTLSSGFLFRFQFRLLYLGCPILGFLSSSILFWPFCQRSAVLVNGPILGL